MKLAMSEAEWGAWGMYIKLQKNEIHSPALTGKVFKVPACPDESGRKRGTRKTA